jgi:hypothetical protein
MRVIAALLMFLGSACLPAQDSSAPSLKPVRPEVRLVGWTLEQNPAAARRFFDPRNNEPVVMAARRSRVCSARLLEMPMPEGTKFALRVAPVPETGDRIFAQAPAPACTQQSAMR